MGVCEKKKMLGDVIGFENIDGYDHLDLMIDLWLLLVA